MKIVKGVALILVLLVGWAGFLMWGISDGFILRPFTSGATSDDFIDAVGAYAATQSVENVALMMIEDGQASATFFYAPDESVGEDTVFPMASISKWVTAWGIFKLIEDGKLDLDTPVDTYLTRWKLPESEFDNQHVTIRRLLSHTSGLVDRLGYAGFGPGEYVQTIEESLTQAADAPWSEGKAMVGIEPGTRYMYSGAAYTILQLVIEEVSGLSFQDFMTQSIFRPLGMHSATFVWSDSTDLQRAKRVDADGNEAPYRVFTALAAASLYTTISDMERFVQANFGANPVLTAHSLDQMYTPHAFVNNTIGIHALGPTIFARNGDGVVIHGHDGSGNLINTAARINRDTRDGIIVFETGHPNLASYIADHWIFWKTGIADYVVINDNKNWLLTLLLGGYVVMFGGLGWWYWARRKTKRGARN